MGDQQHIDQRQPSSGDLPPPYALVAEFASIAAVRRAARRLRDEGFEKWDVHSPFPIHGINADMGLRPTILPWITLVHGVVGCLLGLLLVWWINAKTVPGVPTFLQGYEFLVSGKPLFSLPANIPILFELTVLLAAFGTLLGMLGLNKIPMLANPLFYYDEFTRATDDRFFVVVEAADPLFDLQRTTELLDSLDPVDVELIVERLDAPPPVQRSSQPEGEGR
ncbi:MAG: DUF3341 domain-containing protein [Planctomycetota bacterium]|nr:MAG: DUF3341 domain-containing protein [Planctomycetota bacterium]